MAGLQMNVNPVTENISILEIIKGRLYTVEITFQSSVLIRAGADMSNPPPPIQHNETCAWLSFKKNGKFCLGIETRR